MMKLAALLVAGCSVLSGCVAYETPYRDASPRYSQHDSRQYDLLSGLVDTLAPHGSNGS